MLSLLFKSIRGLLEFNTPTATAVGYNYNGSLSDLSDTFISAKKMEKWKQS